jgi:TRAP-type C4-dicarboxylate transport system substrate-binding protein
MKILKLAAVAAATSVLGLSSALAAEYTLRVQTHYSPEQTSGKLATQFVDDVETMSGGRIDIELFYSSSVVKSVEGFDAAASGILDGEMHGGAYLTGKNPAFQFVGDIMGGYDTPWQQYAWLYHGGGYEAANKLYPEFGMQLIGWWIFGQESLSSSTPIAGPEDLKDWKFRSPPGMETEIFAELGASPIVMDFAEVPTALETGIIEGTDYSTIGNNVSIGLYDIVNHATYPGFLGDNSRAIFGRSYSAEPDVLVEQLKKDEAIAEADTVLLTVPNQLGVDYNAHVIEAILKHVAPGLGWR